MRLAPQSNGVYPVSQSQAKNSIVGLPRRKWMKVGWDVLVPRLHPSGLL